jgi:hypothetical protein
VATSGGRDRQHSQQGFSSPTTLRSISSRWHAEGPGTLGELGFDYAAGPRAIDPWFPAPPMFVWDCPGCGQRIADHGPAKGPISDQDGHKDGCVRLATEAADWEQEAPR